MNKRIEVGDVLLVYDDELKDSPDCDEFQGEVRNIGFLALRTTDESSLLMNHLRSEVKFQDEPETEWKDSAQNKDRMQTLNNIVSAMEQFTTWYRQHERDYIHGL